MELIDFANIFSFSSLHLPIARSQLDLKSQILDFAIFTHNRNQVLVHRKSLASLSLNLFYQFIRMFGVKNTNKQKIVNNLNCMITKWVRATFAFHG